MTEVLFPALPIIVVLVLAVAGAVWIRRGRPRGGVPTDRRWRDGYAAGGAGDGPAGASHGGGDRGHSADGGSDGGAGHGGGDGGGGDGGGGD